MIPPAIVISTHLSGLAVIRALGRVGVPVIAVCYDEGELGYLSAYVSEQVWVPHPDKSETQFVDSLLQHAGRLGGGVLMPTSDAALSAVSRHKELLEQHYIVACTEWKITERLLDKKHTYDLAGTVDVPAPQTIRLESEEDAVTYGKHIPYPCLVKPRLSHQYHDLFRKKMVRVESFDQMLAEYREASAVGLGVMLQELIPGEDARGVNYISYFWNGKPLVEFTAAKVRNAPPNFGSPRVVLSQRIPEILEPGRRILRALGFYGFSCTEFKQDARDGVYKLMEVNGRHNLSGLLAVRCGINFPLIHYRHLVSRELPSPSDYQTGVYWIDLTRDVGNSVRFFLQERYSPWQYARPYLKPHVFAIADWKDPKPLAQKLSNVAKKALKGIRNYSLRWWLTTSFALASQCLT